MRNGIRLVDEPEFSPAKSCSFCGGGVGPYIELPMPSVAGLTARDGLAALYLCGHCTEAIAGAVGVVGKPRFDEVHRLYQEAAEAAKTHLGVVREHVKRIAQLERRVEVVEGEATAANGMVARYRVLLAEASETAAQQGRRELADRLEAAVTVRDAQPRRQKAAA